MSNIAVHALSAARISVLRASVRGLQYVKHFVCCQDFCLKGLCCKPAVCQNIAAHALSAARISALRASVVSLQYVKT